MNREISKDTHCTCKNIHEHFNECSQSMLQRLVVFRFHHGLGLMTNFKAAQTTWPPLCVSLHCAFWRGHRPYIDLPKGCPYRRTSFHEDVTGRHISVSEKVLKMLLVPWITELVVEYPDVKLCQFPKTSINIITIVTYHRPSGSVLAVPPTFRSTLATPRAIWTRAKRPGSKHGLERGTCWVEPSGSPRTQIAQNDFHQASRGGFSWSICTGRVCLKTALAQKICPRLLSKGASGPTLRRRHQHTEFSPPAVSSKEPSLKPPTSLLAAALQTSIFPTGAMAPDLPKIYPRSWWQNSAGWQTLFGTMNGLVLAKAKTTSCSFNANSDQ